MDAAAKIRLMELENLAREMSRVEYDSICAHYGVEAMSDESCCDYAVRYGEFTVADDGIERVTRYNLARRRMRAIDAEKAAGAVANAARNSLGFRRCYKCGGFEVDGIMFTTIPDGDVCDDCL